MLYIILFATLFSFSLKELIVRRAIQLPFFYGMIAILVLLAGIRENTGTDYLSYLKLWNEVEPVSSLATKYFRYAELERGFVFVISCLKQMTSSSVAHYLLLAILAFVPMVGGLKKLKIEYLFVALFSYFLIFYLPYVFNGMRQAIAMGIFLYAVYFIVERKTVFVILLALLAGSFHQSGYLILLAYLVSFFYQRIPLILLLGSVCSVLCYQLGLINYLFFNVLGGSQVYITKFTESTSLFQLASRAGLVVLFYLFSRQNTELYKKIFVMYLLGFFIYVSLADYNVLATRFNLFFRVLEVLLLPLLLLGISDLRKRLAVFGLFLVPFGYTFYVAAIHIDNTYHFISFKS